MKTLNVKSNEGTLYSFLGWKPCRQHIETFQNCKKTNTQSPIEPTLCFQEARSLQMCYTQKAMKIQPICLPIFNDAKECLFKGDTSILSCKEEINQMMFCNNSPKEYLEFLQASLPEQKQPKVYDFFANRTIYNKYE